MMMTHSSRVIGNLLEMATTPVTMDMSNPTNLLQERATKMAEVLVEDDNARKHLYEVVITCMPTSVSMVIIFLISRPSAPPYIMHCVQCSSNYNSLQACCLPGGHSCISSTSWWVGLISYAWTPLLYQLLVSFV